MAELQLLVMMRKKGISICSQTLVKIKPIFQLLILTIQSQFVSLFTESVDSCSWLSSQIIPALGQQFSCCCGGSCGFVFAAPSACAVSLTFSSPSSVPQHYSEAVDEWLILSNLNFKFDLGEVLLLPSDPWQSTLRAWLKAEEDAMD